MLFEKFDIEKIEQTLLESFSKTSDESDLKLLENCLEISNKYESVTDTNDWFKAYGIETDFSDPKSIDKFQKRTVLVSEKASVNIHLTNVLSGKSKKIGSFTDYIELKFVVYENKPYLIVPKSETSSSSSSVLTEEELEDVVDDSAGNCRNISLPTWADNSCYKDSVIVSLFAPTLLRRFVKNTLLEKPIESKSLCPLEVRLQIRDELKSVYKYIHSVNPKKYNIRNFSQKLRLCNFNGEDFGDDEMKDAGEFLQFLFSTLDTNVSLRVDNGQERMDIPIGMFILDSDPHPDFNSAVEPFVYPEFFSIIVQRNSLRGINHSPIQIPEKIDDLRIVSVVIFRSAHYTCYYLCAGVWYYYNDIGNGDRPQITEVGDSFDAVISQTRFPKPTTHGTIFFYAV
jgi:hypothetical protein